MKETVINSVVISLAIIGLLAMIGTHYTWMKITGVVVFFFSLVYLGMLYADIVSQRISGALTITSFAKTTPEKMSRLEGMVISGHALEAAVELRRIIKRNFNDIAARKLLVIAYLDYLDEPEEAANVIKDFFNRKNHRADDEAISLLFLLSDLIPDEEAVVFVEREARSGRYRTIDQNLLNNRLESLSINSQKDS